jgi:hypothetical protein
MGDWLVALVLRTETKPVVPLQIKSLRERVPGTVIAIAIGITLVVGVTAWIAGAQHTALHNQQVISELSDAQKVQSQLRVALDAEKTSAQQLRTALQAASNQSSAIKAASQVEALKREVLRLQAEVNNYQTVVGRDQSELAENAVLLRTLSGPEVRLLPFRAVEPVAAAVAYALIGENGKVVFVAARLPAPPDGRDYQLWILRKDDPKVISGGVFNPEATGRALVEVTKSDLVSAVSGFAVTDEPSGGSESPTGTKLLMTGPEQ